MNSAVYTIISMVQQPASYMLFFLQYIWVYNKYPCGAIKTPTGELNLHTMYSTLKGCLLNNLFLTVFQPQ